MSQRDPETDVLMRDFYEFQKTCEADGIVATTVGYWHWRKVRARISGVKDLGLHLHEYALAHRLRGSAAIFDHKISKVRAR